jgi:hypothetical protein
MTIRLTIDRIVLDRGVAANADPRDLRAALEGELGRLIAAGGKEPFIGGGAARERIAAGPLDAAECAGAGAGLARALYEGLTR